MTEQVRYETLRDNDAATVLRRFVNHQSLPALIDKLFETVAEMNLPLVKLNVRSRFNILPERNTDFDFLEWFNASDFILLLFFRRIIRDSAQEAGY